MCISRLPQNTTEVICCNKRIRSHVQSRRDTFSGFVFHLVQNVYHMLCLPAAGHLVFADSAHSSFLPHPSVKSRAQTQSNLSLLQKIGFFFFLFRKQWLVTQSISCVPFLGFKEMHQRMGSLAFHQNISPLPPGPEASLDLLFLLVLFSCIVMSDSLLLHVWQQKRLPCLSLFFVVSSKIVFIVSPYMCHEVMELDAIILVFSTLCITSKPSPRK